MDGGRSICANNLRRRCCNNLSGRIDSNCKCPRRSGTSSSTIGKGRDHGDCSSDGLVGRVGSGEAWDTGSISIAGCWKPDSYIVIDPGVGD